MAPPELDCIPHDLILLLCLFSETCLSIWIKLIGGFHFEKAYLKTKLDRIVISEVDSLIHGSNEMIIKMFYILYLYFMGNDNICQKLTNSLPFCPPSRSFFKLSYVGQTELVLESFETLSLYNMSITQSYPFFFKSCLPYGLFCSHSQSPIHKIAIGGLLPIKHCATCWVFDTKSDLAIDPRVLYTCSSPHSGTILIVLLFTTILKLFSSLLCFLYWTPIIKFHDPPNSGWALWLLCFLNTYRIKSILTFNFLHNMSFNYFSNLKSHSCSIWIICTYCLVYFHFLHTLPPLPGSCSVPPGERLIPLSS